MLQHHTGSDGLQSFAVDIVVATISENFRMDENDKWIIQEIVAKVPARKLSTLSIYTISVHFQNCRLNKG